MQLDWEDFEQEGTLLLLNDEQVFRYDGHGWQPLGASSPDFFKTSDELESMAQGGSLIELMPNLALVGDHRR